MSESFKDQVRRVASMSMDRMGTWDLSDNDCAALSALLGFVDEALQALAIVSGDAWVELPVFDQDKWLKASAAIIARYPGDARKARAAK